MRPGTLSSALAGLLALLPFAGSGNAQTQAPSTPEAQAAPPPAAVFKSTSALVLVDVIVTNPQGPVHGIPRGQFHLLEDGKEQKLIALEEHDAPDPAKLPKPPELPPNIYGNTADGVSGAVNVLLLDALNTPIADQSYVRQQMISYLKTIRPGTHLAIFTLASRLRIVQGFTSDSRPLLAALNGKSTLPNQSALLADPYDTTLSDMNDSLSQMGATSDAMASIQQFEADQAAFQMDLRVRYTLDALQQLARYLGGVPGRKNLIWFSGSFPISLDPDATLQSPFEAMRNYAPDVTETTRMLSASRVAVYPVDARCLLIDPQFSAQTSGSGMNSASGGGSSMGIGGGSRRGSRGGGGAGSVTQPKFATNSLKFTQQTTAEHATMQQIAEETGGIAFLDRNDLQSAIEQAIQNGASYYTLAYIPEAKPDDNRVHKLQVTIPDAPSYHLAYRHGYVAVSAKKQPPNTGTVSMAAALLRGAPSSSELIFKVRVLPASDPLFKALPTQPGPAGDLSPKIKGPLQRYCLDYAADLHAAALSETTDGVHHANLEFVAVAYDRDGGRLNAIDKAYTVNLAGEKYAQVMQKGLQMHQEIDLPAGEVYLRAAVHDLNSDRIGAIEVPLVIQPGSVQPALVQ
jgi:VWFA-related protein